MRGSTRPRSRTNRRGRSRRCRAERAGAAGGGHAPVRRCPGVCAAGHSGAGHGHPMAPPRTSPRTRAAAPAERRGGARSAGAHRAAEGNLEIWIPGNLRGCGARQVFRFSGFQVFTFPGPAPAGGVARGAASCSGTDREPRETGNLSIQNLSTVTGFQVLQIPRFPSVAALRRKRTSSGRLRPEAVVAITIATV